MKRHSAVNAVYRTYFKGPMPARAFIGRFKPGRRMRSFRFSWLMPPLIALSVYSGGTGALAKDVEEPSALTQALKAGHLARKTCDWVFIAKRPASTVSFVDDNDGKIEQVRDPEIDDARHLVSVPFAASDTPRLAAFRGDFGCVLLPIGAQASFLDRLPSPPPRQVQPAAATAAWPQGDVINTHRRKLPDQKRRAIAAIVDGAFTGKYGPLARTSGVVVVYHGQIVAEQYRSGMDYRTPIRTYSAAKSFASTMIGVAIQKGYLDSVNERLTVPQWKSADPRSEITYDQLLHMKSGLSNPRPDEGGYTPMAYDGGENVSDESWRRTQIRPPGKTWLYANLDVLLAISSLRNKINDDVKYWSILPDLFSTLNMRDTVAETDAFGNYVLSSMVQSTPRDLARLGLLYLADGVWNGVRILPRGWTEYVARPTDWTDRVATGPIAISVKPERGYGAFFWLPRLASDIPAGSYMAHGNGGNRMFVLPAKNLVITRMANDVDSLCHGTECFDEDRFFSDIARAL